jgi:uncharacterized membrane protein (DUF2068 family)
MIVLLLFVLLPIVAAFGLWKMRKWSRGVVTIAATAIFLLGLLLASSLISFSDWRIGIIVFPVACIGMSIYSYWFVYRKPAI